MIWPPAASFDGDNGTSYDVTIQAFATPHLLARVVRILTWQGAMPHRLDYRTNGPHVTLLFTVDANPWRVGRLLAHFRKIHGVVSALACDSSTGEPAATTLQPAPAAR